VDGAALGVFWERRPDGFDPNDSFFGHRRSCRHRRNGPHYPFDPGHDGGTPGGTDHHHRSYPGSADDGAAATAPDPG
jgi:hypothetical protein